MGDEEAEHYGSSGVYTTRDTRYRYPQIPLYNSHDLERFQTQTDMNFTIMPNKFLCDTRCLQSATFVPALRSVHLNATDRRCPHGV